MTNGKAQFFLVTGATSDIGAAITHRLVEDGFGVIATGRRLDRLQALEQTGAKSRNSVVTIACDLSDLPEIDRLADSVEKFVRVNDGVLCGIIHVAGVWHDDNRAFAGVDLENTALNEIEAVLKVTLLAPIYLTKRLLSQLPGNGEARIIGISGTFSSGGAGWLHYFVAKRGLELFLTGLADELRKRGIRVNCISPSDVDTEPLRRFFPDDAATALSPAEVAEVVAMLVSPQARNMTGQVVVVKKQSA